MNKRNKKQNDQNLVDSVALGANSEMLNRYSDAGKQFKVAYDGIDHGTGKALHQGLKGISESKVNPEYAEMNVKQQAGYSAEVLDTAKQNAENIKRNNANRVFRTDDVGRVNDTKADQITLDVNGNVVDGTEVQMKFLGVDAKGRHNFVNKISTRKCQDHYPDGKFRVPSDQYDAIKKEIQEKIEKLNNQDLPQNQQERLRYLKKVEKNLEKSKVSIDQAKESRLNPEKVTIKEISETAHEAGVKAAKVGAVVGCGTSLVTNFVDVLRGEKTPEDAAKDVIITTGKSGVTSYVTGLSDTVLASVMKNSSKEIIRTLGERNAPAYIIQTAVSTTKSIVRVCKDEISINEFFEEIGRSGTVLISSAQGAIIGQVLVPVPVVGALLGGLVSSLLCGVIYDYVTELAGMKMLNEEVDSFRNDLRQETALLKAYQSELLRLDIESFEIETRNFNVSVDKVMETVNEKNFNTMLKLTYEYIGIPIPWDEGSFDNFMNDKSRELTFE
ncbi:MAG: hypothetical protein ACLRPU_08485 [Enterococcus hulanensis]